MNRNESPPPNIKKEAEVSNLLQEKEVLSEQIKRLIRAESRLYSYQEKLDAQLKEYKDLYELNRKIAETSDISCIFNCAADYVTSNLEYERAIAFLLHEETSRYHASAIGGYYDRQERRLVEQLTIEENAPLLVPLMSGKEYLICRGNCGDPSLIEFRDGLRMAEYFLYPLGAYWPPNGLLVVGNTAENVEFYRRVDESAGSLLSMGNVVGVISSSLSNCIFNKKMKEALEEVRRAEAKYRSIFENAVEGIFQRTPSGRYIAANPVMARMLGYASPEELIAKIDDIGSQIYVNRKRYEEFAHTIEKDGEVEGFEAELYRKDGSVIWASICARAVRDTTGKVSFYEGTVEGISERKRAEEALRESEQRYRYLSEALEQRVSEAVNELREKDRMLIIQGRQAVMGETMSNVAHQWRQPLNVLGLLAQDMQLSMEIGSLSRESVDDTVGKMMELIQQMSKTIDDFRNFFRSDGKKVFFKVLDSVEKSLRLLEGSLLDRSIDIRIVRAADPVLEGDPSEFTQVIFNILLNARDALVKKKPAQPMITIKVSSEGGKAVLSITDNAGGIPGEIIDRIFEPYFSTKGPEQGRGIGLFMCRTIIEKNMRGRLTARNVGEGAEFLIEV